MTKTVAERCVLVDLQQKKGKELFPYLDAFALANRLAPEKSHPIAPSYQRRDGDVIQAEVIYTIGMGQFGAELSLFRSDKSKNADLLAAFDKFVTQEVAPRYKTTRCADVPDYKLPEVYR